MRICIISEYFFPDKASTGALLAELAKEVCCLEMEIQIDVITSRHLYRSESINLLRRERWNGIHIFRVTSPRSVKYKSSLLRLVAGLTFTFGVLFHLLKKQRYDLVVVVTNPPTLPIAAYLNLKSKKTPYVYLIHDLYPDIAVALKALRPGSKQERLFHSCQKTWLNSAARVVVLGRCMAKHLIDTYNLPQDKISVITNWADPKHIKPSINKQTRFRERYGLSGFIVLYAGNLGQHQDFDVILDAAKLLMGGSNKMQIVFVGEGAKKEHIVSRIQREGINNVSLYPFVSAEEFSDMLASADVALVTLEIGAEGLGVPSKFYSILASGRPTVGIVAPLSEVAYVVDEAKCGIVVGQGNSKKLADALLELSTSPELVEAMGRKARQVFERKYTITQIAQQYNEVFKSAHDSKRGTKR